MTVENEGEKTDPPRTGLSGYEDAEDKGRELTSGNDEDGTMRLPPDDNDATALASAAFGYDDPDDPGNADEGVPGLVESSASLLVGSRGSNDGSLDQPRMPSRDSFTHGGDTVIASGRSTSKENAVFVTGPVPVSLVGGIGYDADASAPTLALDRSSSSEDLATAAAHRDMERRKRRGEASERLMRAASASTGGRGGGEQRQIEAGLMEAGDDHRRLMGLRFDDEVERGAGEGALGQDGTRVVMAGERGRAVKGGRNRRPQGGAAQQQRVGQGGQILVGVAQHRAGQAAPGGREEAPGHVGPQRRAQQAPRAPQNERGAQQQQQIPQRVVLSVPTWLGKTTSSYLTTINRRALLVMLGVVAIIGASVATTLLATSGSRVQLGDVASIRSGDTTMGTKEGSALGGGRSFSTAASSGGGMASSSSLLGTGSPPPSNVLLPEIWESYSDFGWSTDKNDKDIPVFLHVPRSGGLTVLEILGNCANLVLASDVGVRDGHGTDTVSGQK